jgi:hypothetical protein
MMLTPQQIKARDRELEVKANDGTLELMRFRYEQTIGDPDGGYTYAAYAALVDRSAVTVRSDAVGYKLWTEAGDGSEPSLSPNDYRKLADQSEGNRTAIIAAADVANVSPAEASHGRRPEVKAAVEAAKTAVTDAIKTGKEPTVAATEAAQKAIREHKAQQDEILEQSKPAPDYREPIYNHQTDLAKIAEQLWLVGAHLRQQADRPLRDSDREGIVELLSLIGRVTEQLLAQVERGVEMDEALAELIAEAM